MGDNQKNIKERQLTENIAVTKVIYELSSKEIITAKPCIDMMGADLLAIMKIEDGAKFARIQCKGRTLKTSRSKCSISIEKSYIKGTFTCLAHIRCNFDDSEHLFCFFAHDIKSRKDLWKEAGKQLRASFYGNTFKEKYRLFRFTDSRVKALKEIIKASDIDEEFYFGFGEMEGLAPVPKLTGSGSLSG